MDNGHLLFLDVRTIETICLSAILRGPYRQPIVPLHISKWNQLLLLFFYETQLLAFTHYYTALTLTKNLPFNWWWTIFYLYPYLKLTYMWLFDSVFNEALIVFLFCESAQICIYVHPGTNHEALPSSKLYYIFDIHNIKVLRFKWHLTSLQLHFCGWAT